MPKISLAVCLFRERDFLARLLEHAEGCYDDLVVVHDGPEDLPAASAPTGPSSCAAIDYSELSRSTPLPPGYFQPSSGGPIQKLVGEYHGRFFVGPKSWQQEPHWPFSWWQAQHDWILRLDADEFPSREMQAWLREFRSHEEEPQDSGYTCVWPLWNGKRAVTKAWPNGRAFLFHKRRVRLIGLVEQSPVPERPFTPLQLALRHQPKRVSYGFRNIVFRQSSRNWRLVIAHALKASPNRLARWRFDSEEWPRGWKEIQLRPIRTALRRFFLSPLFQAREMMRYESRIFPSALLGTSLHHFLICLTYVAVRRQ